MSSFPNGLPPPSEEFLYELANQQAQFAQNSVIFQPPLKDSRNEEWNLVASRFVG